MTDGEEHSRKTELQLPTQGGLGRSEVLAARAARAAESAAALREQFDRMVERQAEQPKKLIETLSTVARQQAEIAARKDRLYDAGRGDSRLLPGRLDEPEPAPFSAPGRYLPDVGISCQMCRNREMM